MSMGNERLPLLPPKPITWRDIFSIDHQMIPAKLSYFFLDGQHGLVSTYMILFLTSIGFNIKEAGVIVSMRLASSLLSAPIWRCILARVYAQKEIFVVLCLGTIATMFPLPWVAQSILKSSCNMTQNVNGTEFFFQYECGFQPFANNLFYALGILVYITGLMMSPIYDILDQRVVRTVSTTNPDSDYRRQRICGAIGFGFLTYLIGLTIEHTTHNKSDFRPVFYGVLLSGLFLMISGFVFFTKDIRAENCKSNIKTIVDEDQEKISIFSLWCKLDTNLFLTSVMVSGFCQTIITTYLFTLMKDEMHASTALMGLSVLFASFGEILVFPIAGEMSKILGGPMNCVSISLLAFITRLVILSYIKNPWCVLPVNLLHALSYAIFWPAVVTHAREIAPIELQNTFLSIISNTFNNVGGILGNVIGGFLYSYYGGSTVFFGIAFGCSIWLVMLAFYFNLRFRTCLFTGSKFED